MGILDVLRDAQFQSDVLGGLRDVGNRASASFFGAPVDLAAMALTPLGYQNSVPVGGSEWLGKQMQGLGMVSEARNPSAEFLASMAIPAAGLRAAPALFRVEQAAAQNAARAGMDGSPMRYQRGAMYMGKDQHMTDDDLAAIIMEQLKSTPRGSRVGLRVLPDDVPLPKVGERLRPSKKWIDGVQTDKSLYGTSSISLGKGSEEDVRKAVRLLNRDRTRNGYYPGDNAAIIYGPSTRKGEDQMEVMIKDAQVHWLTDLFLGKK